MRKLEEAYGDRIAVIGVHSGKFTAERTDDHIRDAAIRLDAIHPIVNDRQFRIWRSFAVQAWPTLVVIDPRGYVVGMRAGEFTAEQVGPFIDGILARFPGEPVQSVSTRADPPGRSPGVLRYPGKVAIHDDTIAIADSGSARVIVARLNSPVEARIEHVYRGPFVNPQGLALTQTTLFVADAGAHRIYAIDRASGETRSLAGTGEQARSQKALDAGALSSPWDIELVDDALFVAMAGIHQLWRIHPSNGHATVHAGSGAEELHDGPNMLAALAQPMGVTRVGAVLVICDTESSAVRTVSVSSAGAVRTVVGTGLFDFGDVDGVADSVRLQHPQGITTLKDGRILIADSYNGALKWIDLDTRTSTTWVGGFEEPGGLAASESHVYVADTNAHRIVAVDLVNGTTQPLLLHG